MHQLIAPSIFAADKPIPRIGFSSDEAVESVRVDETTEISIDDCEIEHLEIIESHISGVSLTGNTFDNLSAVDVVFENCELSGVMCFDSRFSRVEFRGCRMSGFVASELSVRDVLFREYKADNCNFRMAKFERLQFVDCELRESDFYSASFVDSAFLGCNLDGADFSQVVINSLALYRSNLESLKGAPSLVGASITSDQILPLAIPIFSSLGIKVEEENMQ